MEWIFHVRTSAPGGRGTPVSHGLLAAVLGVWVGDRDSVGGNSTQQRYLLAFIACLLTQGSFGHETQTIPQAHLSQKKFITLIPDYAIKHETGITICSYQGQDMQIRKTKGVDSISAF